MRGPEPGPVRRRFRQWLGDRVVYGLDDWSARIRAINEVEPAFETCDDRALAAAVERSRDRSRRGADIDEIEAELFAAVREASRRTLGLRPFDEQLGAGLAMASGAVVEMATGEGKTLAAVAPAVHAAITGDGVHILTFNDYLARRDAAWMGPIFELLGVSVGTVQEGMPFDQRQRAYGCDVTYLTAKEAGFDFLRSFVCLEPDRLLRRGAAFALIDEADSILIDEARIPLVIAGAVEGLTSSVEEMAVLARRLRPDIDFDTDDYGHNIFLTDTGAARVEAELGCDNLFDSTNLGLLADLRNALHALHFLTRDDDYIVRGGRVELVDDFTGRVAENRQWPDGLQAAIEAKERLELQEEGRILGSITMQHFLASYPRLCGMTATASSSAEELEEFYGLSVVVVPTHRRCIRVDEDDLVFTHREAKHEALIEEIRGVHATGRPLLVGTASVAESDELASVLCDLDVPCQVLNAKHDEREAAIIAGAGSLGAVTISTNMAGRGTDIKLGGVDETERERVVELGGLYVIGTNRHESLRIDRQLRGRAGRQGDPGSSRFFVSLEDPLIRRYGVEKLISARYLPEHRSGPVDSPVLEREIARAQRIIEGESFDIRRRLWEFSDLVESQRAHLQDWRQRILVGEDRPEALGRRCPEKRGTLADLIGTQNIESIEQRLTLLTVDRCWSDHLAELARIRDGIHVVGFVGKDPVAEFRREASEAFADLRMVIDDEIVTIFEDLDVGPAGVDWEAAGLVGPSSTWTYLVSEAPFGGNTMRQLANRAGFAAVGAIAAAPVLFLWGLVLHWKRRKLKKALRDEEGDRRE